MKKIEIDWNKIYDVNPKGLMEWLGYIPNSTLPYSCQSVNIDGLRFICYFGKGYDRHYTITFNTLNERALDLIFWLDSKGVYIINNWGYVHGSLICIYSVFRKSDKMEFNINNDYKDRQTALATGIEKAFELLKGKS